MADDHSKAFFERVGTELQPRDEGPVGRKTAPLPDTNPSAVANPRWAYVGDTFWAASETCEVLPPAFYVFEIRQGVGFCLIKRSIATDALIDIPDTTTEQVMSEFVSFWQKNKQFTDLGFLHKRGILLWGPPGSGKTASLMLMAHKIIQMHQAIVCQIEHPQVAAGALSMIRKIEPDRPILALMEDLDSLVGQFGEAGFLALLDGETQVNNIVYVATTNYPERLDRRFVDRPSRFDTVRWIGMPTARARHAYLSKKDSSLAGEELETWVRATDGYSVAHLRELIILVRCFDYPLQDALQRLDSMRQRMPNSGDSPDRIPWGIRSGKPG